MKAHQLDVYLRGNSLYIVPGLPCKKGMCALDAVVVVDGGWEGLEAGLRQGEELALAMAEKPSAERGFGKLEKLFVATGCKNFADLVRGTKWCSIIRVPDYVLVTELVAMPKLNTFEGQEQDVLPPDTSLRELARIVKVKLTRSTHK